MDFKEKRKIHWMSFYNSIACVGIVCLLLPYFELASFYVANRYSTIITVTVAPFLLFFGFFTQKILMRFQKKKRNDLDLEYSFDIDSKNKSKTVFFISIAIIVILSTIVGISLGLKFMAHLGPLYSNDFGVALFTVSCVAVGIIGCVLAQFRFYQMLNIKIMIEYIAAYAFLLGAHMYFKIGVSILYVVCFFLFFLCLALCMNQENVVKVEYAHKTCYATNKMRWTGMKSVAMLWGGAIVLVTALLAFCALIRAMFLIVIRAPWSFILYGPIEGSIVFNSILLVIGVILFFGIIILLPIILRNPYVSEIRYKANQFLLKIKNAIMSVIRKIFKIEIQKRQNQIDEINPLFYLDSITHHPPKRHKAIYTKYKDFHRALKTMSNINNQYMFAYRVLMESFCTMDIGLKMSQTPLEMAKLIKEKTNFEDIDILTAKYINIAYSENSEPISEGDMAEICNILRYKL